MSTQFYKFNGFSKELDKSHINDVFTDQDDITQCINNIGAQKTNLICFAEKRAHQSKELKSMVLLELDLGIEEGEKKSKSQVILRNGTKETQLNPNTVTCSQVCKKSILSNMITGASCSCLQFNFNLQIQGQSPSNSWFEVKSIGNEETNNFNHQGSISLQKKKPFYGFKRLKFAYSAIYQALDGDFRQTVYRTLPGFDITFLPNYDRMAYTFVTKEYIYLTAFSLSSKYHLPKSILT